MTKKYEKILREEFEKFDTDRDGFLKYPEFNKILNKLGFPLLSTYDINRIYSKHDLDKNPDVSYDGKSFNLLTSFLLVIYLLYLFY